ncbi:hypothetical protein MLD38_002037 [Melastoma candidum]|uniref:Uncharacterized protein n=1 Tax=Melastoma candidum TaxID=119954 RepID=A0ACB9SF54_9MYRT|nr:hypothetical protein MLD38_002037 [Melastoma candidum]
MMTKLRRRDRYISSHWCCFVGSVSLHFTYFVLFHELSALFALPRESLIWCSNSKYPSDTYQAVGEEIKSEFSSSTSPQGQKLVLSFGGKAGGRAMGPTCDC